MRRRLDRTAAATSAGYHLAAKHARQPTCGLAASRFRQRLEIEHIKKILDGGGQDRVV